jgi:hypothetical protein
MPHAFAVLDDEFAPIEASSLSSFSTVASNSWAALSNTGTLTAYGPGPGVRLYVLRTSRAMGASMSDQQA